VTLATDNKTYTITTTDNTTSADWKIYGDDTSAAGPWWIEPIIGEPFKEPLPPFFCPKHKEIGEDIIEVIDEDGKKHYYCRECVEEIIKKRAKEVDRWEDELTKRDFEEEVEISPPNLKN